MKRTPGLTPAGSAALALLAAALLPPALAAQEPLRTVTLDEAIARSVAVDPAAVAAASGIASARADVLQSRGAWLPTLTLGSTYGNSSNERFDQATGSLVSENYTAQVASGIELFDGGLRLAEGRSAGARQRAASATYREQRYETALATTETFYGAAAADELVAAARQRQERARQQLEFARTRLEVGTATRSDVLRAELEAGNAELAVVEAESGQRTARLQLGQRIGVAGEVQPAAAALPERGPALPAEEELVARAERSAPSALAARASYDERRATRIASTTAYAPTLRATGGYDWTAFDFPPSERSWSLRVIASLPVLNGFQREANVARARASERAAEARAADASIAVRVAAADAAREIGSAERRVEIARRSVELAREDLRVQEERYRLGASTILDLQASQVALTDAEVGWVRARQGLGVAVARLEAVLGETVRPQAAAPAPAPAT
jgi:outer membrane protein TolC